MDNNTPAQNQHCDSCGMCQGKCCGQWHGGHRHFFLRWILGLIILGIVFGLGVKIGEFKSEVYGGNYNGYGRMNRMMQYRQPIMYQTWGTTNGLSGTQSQTTVPPTATKTPTK
jgi:hypothetical protein